MNREQQKKWQKISVILAEALMVLSVVAIVIIMTFVAMGYKFGQDGEIEQSGLMQLHTLPTGATVQLDDEVLFARSNLSQTMSPGEHVLKISKNGYDTWEKTITMAPGRLMRLYYPRLFLQNRQPEELFNVGETAFYSASTNRDFLLFAKPGATEWTLVNAKGDNVTKIPINVAGMFSDPAGKFEKVQWSDDANRVLIKSTSSKVTEWVLVDLKDVTESVNLTKEFGLNFERMEFANSSAGQILSLENGNLRKIDVDGRSISRILIEQVADFDNHGADIVFVTKPIGNVRKIGIYKDGAKNSVITYITENTEQIWVGSSAYYDDDYLIYTIGTRLVVYSGEYPIYEAETMKNGNNQISLDDEDSLMYKIIDIDLPSAPGVLTVSRGGEYILARDGLEVTAIDLDTEIVSNYTADTQDTKWLDDSMLYGVIDGKLLVWDFDGLNKREVLGSNVADQTVMISGNNRYIYYIDQKANLVREKIQ